VQAGDEDSSLVHQLIEQPPQAGGTEDLCNQEAGRAHP
jgi:hypothetical protein